MKYIKLGRTGINVSQLAIGTWSIGGLAFNLNMDSGWNSSSDRESLEGLHQAYNSGINFFDTADIYGHGHSERLIGKFIKEKQNKEIVLSSKVGYFKGTAIHAFHPKHMRNQLETSLSNMNIDCLDIYSFHNTNFGENSEYQDDAIAEMYKFKDEGKIRFIGLRLGHIYTPKRKSSTFEDQLNKDKKLLKIISPDIVQLKNNLLETKWPTWVFDLFEKENIGVVFNKPFAQGLLLNKYSPNELPIFPAGDHRRRKPEFKQEYLARLHKVLNNISDRFKLSNNNLISLCFQACFTNYPKACIVFGFKDKNQVKMNIDSWNKNIPIEVIEFAKQELQHV